VVLDVGWCRCGLNWRVVIIQMIPGSVIIAVISVRRIGGRRGIRQSGGHIVVIIGIEKPWGAQTAGNGSVRVVVDGDG
jgi:hypothetical protein